jgi:signal transduction histidine kinase
MVKAPSGKAYIVGSGMYNDKMEREFVVDAVSAAVAEIEKNGKQAFPAFYDPKGRFIAKDAYVFVIDPTGIELVNPAFPNLEGRNLLELKDTRGKPLVREMLEVIQKSDAGWVDYMWPKPGESVSTQKSTYVMKAKLGEQWLLVGCGVYLADAPKAVATEKKISASQLMALVRDAAKIFEQKGEEAFPEFRQKGSKWFRDDTYFFAWSMDGIRIFHAANPAGEGENMSGIKDVIGRPWGKMFLGTVNSSQSEGWVHYMYPEPGDIFPTWKSSFLKRVSFPSGKDYLVGCGIYNMQMDKAFIEDVVNRACDLISSKGRKAFDELRDKKSSFNFMDIYVFVDDPQGMELVNAAQPSLEGKNLMNVKDVYGKFLIRDYIQAAIEKGNAWVDYYWYKPGQNTVAHKYTYVRKVNFGKDTYIVGAGFYPDEEVQPVAMKF